MTLSQILYPVAVLPIFMCGISRAQNAAFLPKFRADTQLVLVPVTVTDHYGKTIEGLRQENFIVTDDQAPQRIVSFSTADAPCSVGLVLDISGSMRDSLHTAKEVMHAFLGTANPEDEFLLLTVSTEPAAYPEFTTDTTAVEQDIAFMRPGGFTALIDTVYLGLNHMRKAQRSRRALSATHVAR